MVEILMQSFLKSFLLFVFMVTSIQLVCAQDHPDFTASLDGTWKSDWELTKKHIDTECKLSEEAIRGYERTMGKMTVRYEGTRAIFTMPEIRFTRDGEDRVLEGFESEETLNILGRTKSHIAFLSKAIAPPLDEDHITLMTFVDADTYWVLISGTHVREYFRRIPSSAQEGHSVPAFQRLDTVAGCQAESDEFKRLLRDYQFSPNPKRDNSWGSIFGVFLEQSQKGVVSVVIRPPSSATNMPTYSGTLPKEMKSEDTIETLKRKLGEPKRIDEPEKGNVVLYYDGFHVVTLDGKLFELWLTELNGESEQNDEPKPRRRRF